MANNSSILVVGIGQTLRSDDGIGIKAVQAWQEARTAFLEETGIEVWLLPEFSIESLQEASAYDHVILVDAMASGLPAGSVRTFSPDDLSKSSPTGQSAHGWSLAENLELARTLNLTVPENIILIGIEGKTFDMGMDLSSEIEKSIPDVISAIQNKIETL